MTRFRMVFALVFSSLVSPLALADSPPPSGSPQVTLPLAEYERLKKSDEKPSLTVVDVLRVGGAFRGKSLTVAFVGRSSGKLPPEKVIENAEGLAIFGCEGEGLLAHGDDGGFVLTPLAPKFDVKCRLALSGSDRLELKTSAGVLWAESTVSDGELVAGESGGDGTRVFSIVRQAAGPSEGAPVTATGKYKITLHADESRFRWVLEAHNPNRTRQPFDVTLRSGERVQQVDAPAAYDVVGTRYRFELPPGDATLTLTGTLAGTSFTPPVDASVQYVLVESDPLLRPVVSGATHRVSPSEVGIPAEYRGAQAYLLGKGEKLAWTVTRLEALRSTTFAVKEAKHVLFLPADGPALGESHFSLDNQGASDLTLATDPEPTYASFGNEPVLLTKNDAGKLWLPLSHGVQLFELQHRQTFSRTLGFARASLHVPQLDAPVSVAAVEIRYPKEWVPIEESFAGRTRWSLPDADSVLWGLLLLVLTERVLAFLSLGKRERWTVAALLAFASIFIEAAFTLAIVFDVLGAGLAILLMLKQIRWTPSRIAGTAVVGLVAFFMLAVVTTFTRRSAVERFAPKIAAKEAEMSRGDYVQTASNAPASPMERKTRDANSNAAFYGDQNVQQEVQKAASYQGLPAKFDLPNGVRRSTFTRELLAPNGPRTLSVVAMSSTLVFWLKLVPLALLAAALVLVRREIVDGVKGRIAQLGFEEEAAAPALS